MNENKTGTLEGVSKDGKWLKLSLAFDKQAYAYIQIDHIASIYTDKTGYTYVDMLGPGEDTIFTVRASVDEVINMIGIEF